MQAVDFTKLQGQFLELKKKYQRPSSFSNSFTKNQHPSSTAPSTNSPLLSKPLSNVPVKKLSASELKDHQEKVYVILVMRISYLVINAKANFFLSPPR